MLANSCAGIPPTSNPIQQIHYPGPQSNGQSLVVFLPGYRDAPEQFAKRSFISLLNQVHPQADGIAVNSHIGYFEREELVPRLRADVIEPAVARGYDNIVLVGISLGGLGALWVGQEMRDDINALVLFAPYMGQASARAKIAQHGSLKAWVATFGETPTRDELPWLWAANLFGEESQRPVYLAYGRRDRTAPLGDLLAAELPADHVFTSGGGHNWIDWAPLWAEILNRSGGKLFSR